MRPGLVSVTFRQLSPEQIVPLCERAKLEGVEWGGDVHVPHGDHRRARSVGELTRAAGLEVAAYGSYYRCGAKADVSFDAVLETAQELGAPAIRVWVGNRGSAKTSAEEREAVLDDLQRINELAAGAGVRICSEKHDGTLTDTDASTSSLLARVQHPNFCTLWQPPHGVSIEEALASLDICLPRLENVHVFHWWPSPGQRWPLSEGQERWRKYLERAQGRASWALLEFVPGDEPEQLLKDASTLREVLPQS